MAVTANPHATTAARDVLRKGGNALDAALAAQWVLNLVEPQSSGIGGGAFLLYWSAKERKLYAWDGRETAPANATEDFARGADGSLDGFDKLVATGKSVGTPGLVAMLAAAHQRHGARPWAQSFSPAIRLARQGFPISLRLNKLLSLDPHLRKDPAANALYYQTDGNARGVGEILRNPALGRTFADIAQHGSSAFYNGPLAEAIAVAVRERGGLLDQTDLAGYRPRLREAVCADYRSYRVCGMPPPSSAGIAVAQLFALLSASGGPAVRIDDPDFVHRFTEAGRLVFADRARYLADSDFVPVPQQSLLAPDYLARRATLIDPIRSMGRAAAGELDQTSRYDDGLDHEIPATTHLSIVDAQGNAVALTSSVEAAFGSRIMVGGFLLNNQLTDFSFAAARDGKPVANRLAPGKRPLSSMAPTMVFDDKKRLWAVLGSPGGSRIINYVAQCLVALIDLRASPGEAVAALHVGSRNGPTEIESGEGAAALAAQMEARGHVVRFDEMTSGLHLVVRSPSGLSWLGAADPRREGLALGD